MVDRPELTRSEEEAQEAHRVVMTRLLGIAGLENRDGELSDSQKKEQASLSGMRAVLEEFLAYGPSHTHDVVEGAAEARKYLTGADLRGEGITSELSRLVHVYRQ